MVVVMAMDQRPARLRPFAPWSASAASPPLRMLRTNTLMIWRSMSSVFCSTLPALLLSSMMLTMAGADLLSPLYPGCAALT